MRPAIKPHDVPCPECRAHVRELCRPLRAGISLPYSDRRACHGPRLALVRAVRAAVAALPGAPRGEVEAA